MSDTPNPRILVIDDSASIHEDFRKVLLTPRTDGGSMLDLADAVFGTRSARDPAPRFSVDFAFQGEEGLARVREGLASGSPYGLAFVDMRMPPGWDGLETIARLWEVDPDLQVVICTAYADHSWDAIRGRLGSSDSLLILKKPFDHIEVVQLSHALLKKWRTAREMQRHLAELDRQVARRTDELRAANLRFAEAFSASPLPQAILSHAPFGILDVNQAFCEKFGMSVEAVRKVDPETFGRGLDAGRLRRQLERLARGECIDDYAFQYRPPGGEVLNLLCSARSTCIDGRSGSIWVIRDITQQLHTEQQLRHALKMEAVGQLAAGIAHDFNNLLTVIQGYTSEVLETRSEPGLKEQLAPVMTAANQAAALTRQLLIFSRKEVQQRRRLLLSEVIDNLLPMLRRLIGANIQIEWDIAPATPAILADPSSIEQVLVNLVVNARDAMPEGGTIRIGARGFQLDAAAATRQLGAQPGEHVELRVTDTGTGIPPEILPRIFEPFFTTKEPGRGTGLGLSTVYSIARQHHGWVAVESEPGRGASFSYCQPAAREERRQTPAAARLPGEKLRLPEGARLLLAEDDPGLQSLLQSMLRHRGLAFDLAPNGEEALRLWEEGGGAHAVLITDVVMPGAANGIRLAQEIRRKQPRLPVVLMTGFSAALSSNTPPEIPGAPVRIMLKPFSPSDFFSAINEAVALGAQGA